jgi:hypothetical protein
MCPLVILLSHPFSIQYHVLRRRILLIRPYKALHLLRPLHPRPPRDIYNYCHEHLSSTQSSEQRTLSSFIALHQTKTQNTHTNTNNRTTINLLKYFTKPNHQNAFPLQPPQQDGRDQNHKTHPHDPSQGPQRKDTNRQDDYHDRAPLRSNPPQPHHRWHWYQNNSIIEVGRQQPAQ